LGGSRARTPCPPCRGAVPPQGGRGVVPEPGNPQALNRYAYVYNNPLRYTDSTGHIPLDWLVDGVSVGLSAAQFAADPTWENAGWLALDVVLALAPYVPAGVGLVRGAAKLTTHADDAADALKIINQADNVLDASKVDFYVPPVAKPGEGAQALTSAQWNTIGSSLNAGDFTGLDGTSISEALSRTPRDWNIRMQNDGRGVLFESTDPSNVGATEFRIKAADPRYEPNYEQFAIGRVGRSNPGSPEADRFGMEYFDNSGRIPSRSSPTWNRDVHLRLPFR